MDFFSSQLQHLDSMLDKLYAKELLTEKEKETIKLLEQRYEELEQEKDRNAKI